MICRYLRVEKRDKAVECFQRCVDVTPAMAADVMAELRRLDVPFIVAPYEADAQLGYVWSLCMLMEHVYTRVAGPQQQASLDVPVPEKKRALRQHQGNGGGRGG